MKEIFINVMILVKVMHVSTFQPLKDSFGSSEVFQSEIGVLNRKLETVHNEYRRIAKENVGLKQEVAAMKDEMNGMRGTLEEILNKCDLNNVSKNKRLLAPGETPSSVVAFYAQLSRYVNLASYQTVEYDIVKTDIGHSYNPQHGIFTAPVKGLYLFSASICTTPDNAVHLNMVKNGNIVAYLYSHNNGWDLGSQTVVLELTKGDEVWMKHDPKYDPAGKATLASLYNSFSGVLLHQII